MASRLAVKAACESVSAAVVPSPRSSRATEGMLTGLRLVVDDPAIIHLSPLP